MPEVELPQAPIPLEIFDTVHGKLGVILHPEGLEVQLDGLPVFKSFQPEIEPQGAQERARGDFLVFCRNGVLLLKRPGGPPHTPSWPPSLRNTLLEFIYAQE